MVDDQFDYGGLSESKEVTVGVVQPPEHYNWWEPEKSPETWEISTRIHVEYDDIEIDEEGFATDVGTLVTDWSAAVEATRTSISEDLPGPDSRSGHHSYDLEPHTAALLQAPHHTSTSVEPGLG